MAPQTREKEAQRELLRQQVFAVQGPLVAAQIANALGVQHFVLRDKAGKFEKVTSEEAALAALNNPDAVFEFWTRDPSIQAFTDLMNRTLGKPPEAVELSTPSGPLEIIVRKPWNEPSKLSATMLPKTLNAARIDP